MFWVPHWDGSFEYQQHMFWMRNKKISLSLHTLKETKSATMNIFQFFSYFLFKSFVLVELSYVFTMNLFTIAENCTQKWIIL